MPKVRLNNVTREAALAALFNRAKPQGLGMLQYDKNHVMTENEARLVLMNGDYVDYLEGRVIKVDFKNPKIRIGTGKFEWGAEPGKNYFVITWGE